MTSSSSDSESDESEPIRKIKINIRPKNDVVKKAADVNEIKASVEAWRPLGPPTHPSLSRRQSSLSSVSSISFGTPASIHSNSNMIATPSVFSNFNPATSVVGHGHGASNMRSSPSCSSLVSDFGNRASFSNFMSTTSRTTSPLTLANISDPIPIAIAIQESIELTVKGHYDPEAKEPKYVSRCLGNIKVAFTNAFAKGSFGKPATTLKLSLITSDRVNRYYASRLIRDPDGLASNQSSTEPMQNRKMAESQNPKQISIETNVFSMKEDDTKPCIIPSHSNDSRSTRPGMESSICYTRLDQKSDSVKSDQTNGHSKNKIIEFDMESLMSQLKKLYDQDPKSKYYNVDVLRYQLTPLQSIEQSPLQVCAYWKMENDLVKLRVDFKHSPASGFNLERLREISFTVNMSQFFHPDAGSSRPSENFSNSKTMSNSNNNYSDALNMNIVPNLPSGQCLQGTGLPSQTNGPRPSGGQQGNQVLTSADDATNLDSLSNFDPLAITTNSRKSITGSSMNSISASNNLIEKPANTIVSNSNNSSVPSCLTYEPQAHWNNSIKQLTWKFDTLLPYHKSDGFGSLFAKMDFRKQGHLLPANFLANQEPSSVAVKFLVSDATLSKINIGLDSTGYKMSLLKKEIRSGRYESEPYLVRDKTIPGSYEPLL